MSALWSVVIAGVVSCILVASVLAHCRAAASTEPAPVPAPNPEPESPVSDPCGCPGCTLFSAIVRLAGCGWHRTPDSRVLRVECLEPDRYVIHRMMLVTFEALKPLSFLGNHDVIIAEQRSDHSVRLVGGLVGVVMVKRDGTVASVAAIIADKPHLFERVVMFGDRAAAKLWLQLEGVVPL